MKHIYQQQTAPRFLIVVNSLTFGGIEKVALSLHNSNHNVALLALCASAREISVSRETDLHRLKSSRIHRALFSFKRQVLQEIRAYDNLTVVCTQPAQIFLCILSFNASRSVYWCHNRMSINSKKSLKEYFIWQLCTKALKLFSIPVISCSETVCHDLLKYRINSQILRNPIPSSPSKLWTPRNGHNQQLRLISVGRLVDQKNYIDLIKNLHKSTSMEKLPTKLDIYGDGPLKEHIQSAITQLPAETFLRVDLKGVSPIIMDLIANYDAYITNSLYEGYPITIMEAAATGIPIIFPSDLEEIKEVLAGYEAFFIFERKIADSMGKALQEAKSNEVAISKPFIGPEEFLDTLRRSLAQK